jgi:hypothetical protein
MKPSELLLPYPEWKDFEWDVPAEDQAWLLAWSQLDLALSPMDDDQRRYMRLGHYRGWHHAMQRKKWNERDQAAERGVK